MRTESLDKVQLAMKDKAEYSARQIERRTGLSYNTVLTALKILGAQQVPDTKPRRWKIAEGIKTVESKPATGTFLDTLVEKWEGGEYPSRERFAANLKQLAITLDANPRELADHFETGAATLTNMAYTLREVATKPDWFELIGGKIEDHQVN